MIVVTIISSTETGKKKSHLPLVVIVRIKSLSVAYMILVVLMTIRFSADENFTFVPDPS
jgi:hypothetical protein